MIKATLERERENMGSESCGLIIYWCPTQPFPICLWEVSLENYISQVPLLTDFLPGSANGRLQWEFEGGRKRSLHTTVGGEWVVTSVAVPYLVLTMCEFKFCMKALVHSSPQ
jgi:hypothetical protein